MEIPTNITNVSHTFLNGSHDITLLGFQEPEKALKTMAYCILFLVSLTGNTLIIWAIYRDHRLRTNTNILVANMAVSDLVFALLVAPSSILEVNIDGRWLIDGDFGLALCKLVYFLSVVFMAVSVYSCIFIAIDGYYAVARPFKGGFSRSRLKYIIPGIWMFATVINVFILYNRILVKKGASIHCTLDVSHVGMKISFIIFLVIINAIPISVIAILYSMIVYKLRQHKVPGQSLDSLRMRREQQNKKVLKMAVAITSLLFFSWLLFDINWFLLLFGKHSHLPVSVVRNLTFVGLFFMHSTVTYNFFICLIFNDIYRHNFKSIFSCGFKCPNLSIRINRRIESMPQEVGKAKAEIEVLSVTTLQAK